MAYLKLMVIIIIAAIYLRFCTFLCLVTCNKCDTTDVYFKETLFEQIISKESNPYFKNETDDFCDNSYFFPTIQ